MAARIESFTLGGEIWICDTTRRALGATSHIEAEREVHPKGFANPLLIHRVWNAAPDPDREHREEQAWVSLAVPPQVAVKCLDGKSVSSETKAATLLAVRRDEVELELQHEVHVLDEILIQVGDAGDGPSGFAKVMSVDVDRVKATFSAPSEALRGWMEATLLREPS